MRGELCASGEFGDLVEAVKRQPFEVQGKQAAALQKGYSSFRLRAAMIKQIRVKSEKATASQSNVRGLPKPIVP